MSLVRPGSLLGFLLFLLSTVGRMTAQSLPAPPVPYAVTKIVTGGAAALNNSGQVAGISNGSYFLWTPFAPNGTVGNLTSIGVTAPYSCFPCGATALNGRGQVAGTMGPANDVLQAFVWSPDVPNGSSGTATAFLGNTSWDASYAVAIDNDGQIVGAQGGIPFLWTPSTPNGITGTLNQDSRFNTPRGIMAINDFGQVIDNYPATLFTPSVANGAAGSFTPVAGLPGSQGDFLIAINRNGTILGESCMPAAGRADCNHGFLWTPTTPNGTTGTAMEIPLPAGYVSMHPVALNGNGQVVGTIAGASAVLPFLYSGGTIYDLSGLGVGGMVEINDQGQILFDAYLATPGIAPPSPAPGAVAVTIAAAFNPQPGLITTMSGWLAYAPPFTVSGTGCSAGGYNPPQTLYWTPGSTCTISFLPPQSIQLGSRSVFQNWQDGPAANPRVIAVPAQATTYTAVFEPQFLIAATANPPNGGTVSGGGWYTGTNVATLQATAASGYRLVDWSPAFAPAGSVSAAFTVYQALTITVNFEPLAALPGNYQMTTILTSPDGGLAGEGINNFGQVVDGSLAGASLWTPLTANATMGNTTTIGGLPMGGAGTGINNFGQVGGVSMRENGFGDIDWSQPFLWTPSSPNGTSGTVTLITGSVTGPTLLAGINNYGQIAGTQNARPEALPQYGSAFLWTPSAPNGTAGTVSTDSRFTGVVGINDFGQAIMNGQPPMLFTPAVAHASSGTFTALTGLGSSPQLIAINAGGTILGVNSGHGFLWTPAAPNGASGSATGIPPMAGFVSMTPAALNARGDVTGIVRRADGVAAPFLYSGGTSYDLSALSAELRQTTPAGMNDRGQIILNEIGAVFLLTPGTSQPPSPVTAGPASGSGSTVTMTFTFSDPRGWQDLDVVNILIDSSLDGRNACYLAYSQPSKLLYLVGDSGGGLLPPLTPGGAGIASNSQCTVNAAGLTVDGGGDALALTIALTFSASFAGNQAVYLAARDREGGNSGWQPLGTWNVPGPPVSGLSVSPMTPAESSSFFQTYTFTFADTNGSQDIAVTDILINNALDGRQACYMAFVPQTRALLLVDDAGDAAGPYQGFVVGDWHDASNSQCTVSGVGSSVDSYGNVVILKLGIAFTGSFAGNRVFYVATRSSSGTSGWQTVGSVAVP